ncbi:hypothetical protein N7474_005189 [Penicillium riverlandense]|uniref:uncharacterized protein n=1 Tax=Penicillium riverlandense TaxID=1903569 RepID=UPI0025467FED|nr:uncharacterized protein N7474_005189 [Penicillium riverlandense]KAJ5819598.1 hypothetical protein N7474_005189 [Penicillium riverlandense]
MLASPLVALVAALYATFLIINYFVQLFHHRRNAKALHCKPATNGDTSFWGIPAFLRLTKAVREKRWIEYVASQYAVYGYTFRLRFLSRSMLSTIEPENVKAILATQFQDFSLGTRHEQFYPFLGDGIFTLDGPGWTHARGLLRPQFTRDQVADLALLDDHITNLIDLIPKDRSSFDIQHLFFLLTLDSATHFLFGEAVGCMSPSGQSTSVLEKYSVRDGAGFAEAFNTAQEWLSARTRAQGLYWVINPKEFRDATRKVHEVVDHYVNIALESKRHPESKDPNGRYIFLEALAAETDNPKMLRDNMLNILLAGRDTTASLLSSVFFYLARHPNVWNRLRREIVDVFGDSKNSRVEITQTKLKDIPYLRYVLNETLRLQPPVPANFRIATKDTSLPVGGGPDHRSPIYIKKGTMVMYNVYAMHRRTDFWGADAHLFRPERWEENAKHGWEYLPFNGGPRICLGQQYALTEASYTVVRLMQHFDSLENADPHPRQEPIKLSNLTMMHDLGVPVKLYASDVV